MVPARGSTVLASDRVVRTISLTPGPLPEGEGAGQKDYMPGSRSSIRIGVLRTRMPVA